MGFTLYGHRFVQLKCKQAMISFHFSVWVAEAVQWEKEKKKGVYHSRLQKARHSHPGSPSRRRRASAWERRRTTPGSWTGPEHMSPSLRGKQDHVFHFHKPKNTLHRRGERGQGTLHWSAVFLWDRTFCPQGTIARNPNEWQRVFSSFGEILDSITAHRSRFLLRFWSDTPLCHERALNSFRETVPLCKLI